MSHMFRYFAACVINSWPYSHPLNIAWMAENTGSVGKNAVASGAVIGFANIYGAWASQIYQASDAPSTSSFPSYTYMQESTLII